MTNKDIETIHYYRYLRMMGEIDRWKKEGVPILSFEDVESLINPQPIYAANIYKAIAYNYYVRKDYAIAKEFYEKAFQCYPTLVGVASKLKIINNKHLK